MYGGLELESSRWGWGGIRLGPFWSSEHWGFLSSEVVVCIDCLLKRPEHIKWFCRLKIGNKYTLGTSMWGGEQEENHPSPSCSAGRPGLDWLSPVISGNHCQALFKDEEHEIQRSSLPRGTKGIKGTKGYKRYSQDPPCSSLLPEPLSAMLQGSAQNKCSSHSVSHPHSFHRGYCETCTLSYSNRPQAATQYQSPGSFGENYTLVSHQISRNLNYPTVMHSGRLKPRALFLFTEEQ